MRSKKIFGVILFTILIAVITILPTISNAATLNPSLYFGITEVQPNSTQNGQSLGYAIGNPAAPDNGPKIWNIVQFSNSSYSDPTATSDVYCIRAGFGFSLDENGKKQAEYTNSFDLKTEKDQITDQRVVDIINRTTTVEGKQVNAYDAIVAMADLFYLPGKSTAEEKQALLENAGCTSDVGYSVSTMSDALIQAVQQAALWYYTNADDPTHYQKYNDAEGNPYTTLLYYTSNNGSTYDNLDNFNPTSAIPNDDNHVGQSLQRQAISLYRYLVKEAAERAGNPSLRTKITLYTNLTTNAEQPLIKIEKKGEFDLALRKYITEVDGTPITNTRVPNIDQSTIETNGTATYKHKKDPVLVKTGSVITYNLTVYNEGDIAGRASKIVDQLPTGLISNLVTGTTVTSTKGNVYTVTYNAETNRITFETTGTQNISGYNGTTLDSDTIEIECTVTSTEANKVLTNVAWISEEIDETGLVITTNKGDDRDSEPGTTPNVNKDSMEDYKGTTTETDLSKSDTYYPGQQDDDDFEKVMIPGNFDLKLIKRIVEVNSTAVPNRIENVDITNLANGTSTTADYTLNKTPVAVKKGDLVKYTIRVYNEGNIDGYAQEITDDLPEGLEFLTTGTTEAENEAVEFNKNMNWTAFTGEDGKNYIKTDYLAKGKGAEITTPGANLIKAFDSSSPYSDTESSKNPDYREVSVILKVVADDIQNGTIRNEAAITEDADKDGNPVDDRDSKPEEWVKYEDDEDYDVIVLQQFDLKLIKRIVEVNGTEVPNRIEKVDITNLANGTSTTADYTLNKTPVSVKKGDLVKYTIRVYNEGQIDGYAQEITDDIPEGLEFLAKTLDMDESTLSEEEKEAIEFNLDMNWSSFVGEDGKTYIKTDYLARGKGEELTTDGANLIKAFDSSSPYSDTEGNRNPDYREVSVILKVVADDTTQEIIRNEAAITEDADEDGNPVDDRDSKPEEWVKYEDDEDYDNVILQEFDLALRKFITDISGTEVTTRVPEVSYNEENEQITYTHPKDPLEVVTGDIVTYTIRVYNEGSMNGYAKEIMDDIPDGLEFIPENEINTEYRWVMYREVAEGEEIGEDAETIIRGGKTYIRTEEVEEADIIVTDYLSKEQEETEGENLLEAFNPDEEISDTNPDHKEVKVAFRVVEPNGSDKVLVNSAQISDDSDEEGNPVDDEDSTPGEWNEGEDDQDKEYVKLTYFDLSLRKWVTEAIVIKDGKEAVTQTGHTADMETEPPVKVEIHRNDLNKVTVKFRFSIRVTNEGDIAGYAKEITDYVPEGLKFVAEDNPGWTDEGNNVISTRLLENTLLQPGESAEVSVLLTWINGQDNMGLKTNTAEISEDDNDKDVPDRDSTPDNQKPGEDDIDDAPVILSVSTGQVRIYYTLGFMILITIGGGVFLIKKFVL